MGHHGFLQAFPKGVDSAPTVPLPELSGQPSGLATGGGFLFATGIECSNPTIAHGRIRRDLLEECGHYARWREDLALVRELGLRFLRYGLPYHLVHRGPGQYDWEFADLAMAEMQRLGIIPILDLMHFGAPDWLGNFQNPELPGHFAAYARAVARRYPWVRHHTPVNEMYVTARISAKDGLWNEQLRTDQGFVTALKHVVAANILASHAIAEVRPDAIIIPSESAEFVHEGRTTASAKTAAFNAHRFMSLDLLYARPFDAETRAFAFDNGLTAAEYAWFMPPRAPVTRCWASTTTAATSTSSPPPAAAFQWRTCSASTCSAANTTTATAARSCTPRPTCCMPRTGRAGCGSSGSTCCACARTASPSWASRTTA